MMGAAESSRVPIMAILLAYFLWMTTALALMVTAWIGVGNSVSRVHPRDYPPVVQADVNRLAAEPKADSGTVAAAKVNDARAPRG